MFNAINTKLLLVIALTLASIAGLLTYQNAKLAQREDAEAKARAAELKAQAEMDDLRKNHSLNWGNSAATIKNYRPK
jgi:hypothetical protein